MLSYRSNFLNAILKILSNRPATYMKTNTLIPKCPIDFDAFWKVELNKLDEVNPAPSLTFVCDIEPGLKQYQLEFTSQNRVRIYGYALIWETQKAPLVLHTNGYNSHVDIQYDWAKQGVNVLGFDTRGFGRSQESVELHADGHILTGFERPQTSILAACVCDYIQAHRAAKELLSAKVSKTVYYGFSFAGAMAIQAAAISNEADLLVTGAPTFGWHELRRQLPINGSGAEVRAFLDQHPSQESLLMESLNYFDSLHFASKLTCPILVGIGLIDETVPAITVQAIIDKMPSHRMRRAFSHSHCEQDELIWQTFIDEMIELAHQDEVNL